jgi:hypothetical protein
VADQVASGGAGVFKTLLDFNILITKKYTNPRYYDEIRGISDGSGVSQRSLQRMNLVPGMLKVNGATIGLWGVQQHSETPSLTKIQAACAIPKLASDCPPYHFAES